MGTWRNRWVLRTSVCSGVLLCSTLMLRAQDGKNFCIECHGNLDPPLGVKQDLFAKDIHVQAGFTCTSCHGGDSSSDDPSRAMGKVAGFRGHISRKDVPQLCGKCHSDAAYIRQYNPSLRTDQLVQYVTSQHGKRLAAGDTKVAVCTDCHGVHGILPPSDEHSPVRPTNIAGTCSRCHADTEYMKAYKISTNQYADYTQSVHSAALSERGDLSAPTCSTCHGNHGAVPPGVATVENVCATCHLVQTQLFDNSPHKKAFLLGGLPGCVTCHGNHNIGHAGDEMIAGSEGKSLCVSCHELGGYPMQVAVIMRERIGVLQSAIRRSDEILSRAERSGMEVGEAKLQQTRARDALTKARVSVHRFVEDPVESEVTTGLKTTAVTYTAGEKALAEREFRRKGLGISLVLILCVVVGLWLYIREIERNGAAVHHG